MKDYLIYRVNSVRAESDMTREEKAFLRDLDEQIGDGNPKTVEDEDELSLWRRAAYLGQLEMEAEARERRRRSSNEL